jgi:hypothetical protein
MLDLFVKAFMIKVAAKIKRKPVLQLAVVGRAFPL